MKERKEGKDRKKRERKRTKETGEEKRQGRERKANMTPSVLFHFSISVLYTDSCSVALPITKQVSTQSKLRATLIQ